MFSFSPFYCSFPWKHPQGWCDVPLTEEGKNEASEAGKLLAAAGYRFDVAHASVLKRACTSLHRLLEGCGQPFIPIKNHWRLNERLDGLRVCLRLLFFRSNMRLFAQIRLT